MTTDRPSDSARAAALTENGEAETTDGSFESRTVSEAVFAPPLGGIGFALGDPTRALELLSRYTGDCVKVVDLDGRIIRWNGACEEFFGWKAHEVLGTQLPYVAEKERLRAVRNIRDVAAGGRVVERATKARRADGSIVALHMVAIPVIDDDGNAAGVLSITREAASDTRLERQREDFAAVVSRQVRDPITAILGYAQLLRRSEILEDAERRERTVKSLADCAERVSTLLEDLLLIYDFEDGRLVLEMAAVDLGELATEVVERTNTHGTQVLVDFEPNVGGVRADGRRIAQALACLVDNAVRYSPDGASVGVSVYAVGNEAVVEVADTGPGIPLAEQPRIFDRFYSGASPDGHQPGIGIGLYLVRVIADAHGGTISVASAPGAGSTFTLRLPRQAS